MDGDITIIIILVVAIAVITVVFRIVDSMLKSKPKPKEEKKKEEPKKEKDDKKTPPAENPKEVKIVNETVIIKTSKSLADEIEKDIQKENEKQQGRGQAKEQSLGSYHPPMSRVRPYDRIKKYREQRNYVEYDEINDQRAGDDDDDPNQPVYDREEYKKMVALLSKPVSNP